MPASYNLAYVGILQQSRKLQVHYIVYWFSQLVHVVLIPKTHTYLAKSQNW